MQLLSTFGTVKAEQFMTIKYLIGFIGQWSPVEFLSAGLFF
jgi:hypothetical protein